MLSGFDFQILLSGFILIIASVDDLFTRKIHNKLILILLPFVLLLIFLLGGTKALLVGLFSAFLALIIGIPLSLSSVLGGGDLKLLVLLALTMNWFNFLKIFIYSLPWALLLGIVKIALDRKLKDFFFNLVYLFWNRKNESIQFHRIPFSVALFLAWLSFFSLQILK